MSRVTQPSDSSLTLFSASIFKSGNCYLPVGEDLPPARKLLLVSDSSAAIIFTTADIAPQFANVAAEVQVVVIDGDYHIKELTQLSTVKPHVEYNQHDPGYCAYVDVLHAWAYNFGIVLYTSGSTGKPKGCLISHGNFSSYIETLYYLASCYCPPEPFLGTGRWLARTSIALYVFSFNTSTRLTLCLAVMSICWKFLHLGAMEWPQSVHLVTLFSQIWAIRCAISRSLIAGMRMDIVSSDQSNDSQPRSLAPRAVWLTSQRRALATLCHGRRHVCLPNHKRALLTRVVGEKISVKVVEDWGNDPNGLLIFNACTSLGIIQVYC